MTGRERSPSATFLQGLAVLAGMNNDTSGVRHVKSPVRGQQCPVGQDGGI